MKLSPTGEAFIKGFEELRLVGYLPTPKDKPTIGWGHTGKMPDGVTPVTVGAIITEAEAEQLFELDTAWASEAANKANDLRIAAGHPCLLQCAFDAVVSLAFNIGDGNFEGSHVRRYIIEADDVQAKPWWLAWNQQAGQVLDGLKRRRAEEWAMWSETSAAAVVS